MTEKQLYDKIKETLAAIKEYEDGKIEKGYLSWDKEIKTGLTDLIQKSHVLGSTGNACPRCGGSGRA
jgi:hypothetical protein